MTGSATGSKTKSDQWGPMETCQGAICKAHFLLSIEFEPVAEPVIVIRGWSLLIYLSQSGYTSVNGSRAKSSHIHMLTIHVNLTLLFDCLH